MAVTPQHPLRRFVIEADRLLDLSRHASPVSDELLAPYLSSCTRLGFLRDLVGRARILAHCYEKLLKLADDCRDLQYRYKTLPPDPLSPSARTVPADLVEAEERWLEELDAMTSLVYYEVTSVVGMLRQLEIGIDEYKEVRFLVKVRGRFFSHVQLAGVRRGQSGGWSLPTTGYMSRDVVALNSWSQEELRSLGEYALKIGSAEWTAQRARNEELLLSRRRNDQFSELELRGLRGAGIRECNLELVGQQFGELLSRSVISIIAKEADRAIHEFGFERWPGA